jgi:putative heme-binding domain-containing protein
MRTTLHCCVVLATFWVASESMAQQHAGGYSPADVENGARLYGAHCSACHGAEGNTVAGVDLRRGQFRRGSSDDDLTRVITTGIPGTAMPPNKFTPSELYGIIAYVRSMRDFKTRSVTLGDPHRGRLLFEGKGACMTCHRVNGKGSRLAVDLCDIGAIRPAEALERSLIEPGRSVLPQNRFVRAVTRDGKTINGRRLNEDTFTIQLIDEKERLVSLVKPELREYTVIGTSLMPSYKDKFSSQERADVIAYLVSLKAADKP